MSPRVFSLRTVDDVRTLVGAGGEKVSTAGFKIVDLMLAEVCGEDLSKKITTEQWLQIIAILISTVAAIPNPGVRHVVVEALSIIDSAWTDAPRQEVTLQ